MPDRELWCWRCGKRQMMIEPQFLIYECTVCGQTRDLSFPEDTR